jgi:integrase
MRGDGRIFQRKGSSVYWCAYYLRGKEFRESTGTAEQEKAEKFLKRRLREVGADVIGAKQFVGPQSDRIRISCGVIAEDQRKPECDCLCCALEREFRLRDKASAQNLSNLKRVRLDFTLQRAASLTADQIDLYIQRRLADGSASASINRATQLLGQAFNLAVRQKRLGSGPFIRHLSEAGNVRQGFFGEADFQSVVSNLPDYLKDLVRFAYLTGMRKGEIASLRWDDVDGDTIHLRAENAKNGEARTIPIEGELADLMERRGVARQVRRADLPITLSAWIFHRNGERIGDFRKAWAAACVMAGLGQWVCPRCDGMVDAQHKCAPCAQAWTREELKYVGRIFHDFRRTAVRDMVRAGVPETVAMSISGHKTRSMFDRYNIHDERDQREALRATQAYREQQAVLQREKLATMSRRAVGVN